MPASRHYQVCLAIKETLEASEFLSSVISRWSVQKRCWNRFRFSDVVGSAFIAPMTRETMPFENIKTKWILPCLVGVMIPSDGSVTLSEDDDDILIKVAEYIEDVFNYQGINRLPPAIATIGSANTGDDVFYFESCHIESGDPYLDPAVQSGLDAVGVVVRVGIHFNKKDFSTLGA